MSPAELATRRPRLVLLLLAAGVALSFQGSRGLYETTEGRYAESALEMVRSGDYLEPTLAGRPTGRSHPWPTGRSPPGSKWPGRTDGGRGSPTRSPSARRSSWSRASPRRSGTASPPSWRDSSTSRHRSRPRRPRCCRPTPSSRSSRSWPVYLFVRAWREAEPARSRRFVRAMWLAWGLAFLTKGPPALLPLRWGCSGGGRWRSPIPSGSPRSPPSASSGSGG
jgi:4-amino-4-deoxy-L-arabinose transferase